MQCYQKTAPGDVYGYLPDLFFSFGAPVFRSCVIDTRVYYRLLVSLPVTWAMDGIVYNVITYASGFPRDPGVIFLQLVLGRCGHIWRSPNYVDLPYTPLLVYLLIDYSARIIILMD